MAQARRECAAPPMGELTTAIHINVAEIPDHVRDDLAATVLDFIVRLKKDGLLPT